MKLGTIDIDKIYVGSNEITKGFVGSSEIYSGGSPVPPGPDYTEPFYIEDISGSDNTLTIKKDESKGPTLTMYKSSDGVNWISMGKTSTTGVTATIPANGRLYLRCNTGYWTSNGYGNGMTCTGNYNIGGNSMSLLYGSSFTGNETVFPDNSNYQFNSIFRSSTTLKSAANLLLPATTLADNCYSSMFYGCTGLTSLPDNLLPATTLATGCYQSMFNGCTGLTSLPDNLLPATTLADNCYSYMFYGCTSITKAPLLPATTLATGCYRSMFINCKLITKAPLLPATTLAANCYSYMFSGCTSLNYIKVYFTSWPDLSTSSDPTYRGTYLWTQLKVNTTGTFVCPSTLPQYFNASGNNTTGTTIENCSNAIPYGWTVQTF